MRWNSRTKEVEEDLTLPTSYTFVCEINLKAQEIEFEYHTCAMAVLMLGVWSSVLDGSIWLKHRAEADLFIQRHNALAIQHQQNSNSHSGTAAVASRCRCTAASWWTVYQYIVNLILSSPAQEIITLSEIKCLGWRCRWKVIGKDSTKGDGTEISIMEN